MDDTIDSETSRGEKSRGRAVGEHSLQTMSDQTADLGRTAQAEESGAYGRPHTLGPVLASGGSMRSAPDGHSAEPSGGGFGDTSSPSRGIDDARRPSLSSSSHACEGASLLGGAGSRPSTAHAAAATVACDAALGVRVFSALGHSEASTATPLVSTGHPSPDLSVTGKHTMPVSSTSPRFKGIPYRSDDRPNTAPSRRGPPYGMPQRAAVAAERGFLRSVSHDIAAAGVRALTARDGVVAYGHSESGSLILESEGACDDITAALAADLLPAADVHRRNESRPGTAGSQRRHRGCAHLIPGPEDDDRGSAASSSLAGFGASVLCAGSRPNTAGLAAAAVANEVLARIAESLACTTLYEEAQEASLPRSGVHPGGASSTCRVGDMASEFASEAGSSYAHGGVSIVGGMRDSRPSTAGVAVQAVSREVALGLQASMLENRSPAQSSSSWPAAPGIVVLPPSAPRSKERPVFRGRELVPHNGDEHTAQQAEGCRVDSSYTTPDAPLQGAAVAIYEALVEYGGRAHPQHVEGVRSKISAAAFESNALELNASVVDDDAADHLRLENSRVSDDFAKACVQRLSKLLADDRASDMDALSELSLTAAQTGLESFQRVLARLAEKPRASSDVPGRVASEVGTNTATLCDLVDALGISAQESRRADGMVLAALCASSVAAGPHESREASVVVDVGSPSFTSNAHFRGEAHPLSSTSRRKVAREEPGDFVAASGSPANESQRADGVVRAAPCAGIVPSDPHESREASVVVDLGPPSFSSSAHFRGEAHPLPGTSRSRASHEEPGVEVDDGSGVAQVAGIGNGAVEPTVPANRASSICSSEMIRGAHVADVVCAAVDTEAASVVSDHGVPEDYVSAAQEASENGDEDVRGRTGVQRDRSDSAGWFTPAPAVNPVPEEDTSEPGVPFLPARKADLLDGGVPDELGAHGSSPTASRGAATEAPRRAAGSSTTAIKHPSPLVGISSVAKPLAQVKALGVRVDFASARGEPITPLRYSISYPELPTALRCGQWYRFQTRLSCEGRGRDVDTPAVRSQLRFWVSPTLPPGLILCETSGEIQGVVQAEAPATEYEVTVHIGDRRHARQSVGTCVLRLSAQFSPAGLKYAAVEKIIEMGEADSLPPELRLGKKKLQGPTSKDARSETWMLLRALLPMPHFEASPVLQEGVVDRFEITPEMPKGMTFDVRTGKISGVPNHRFPAFFEQTFEVFAYNAVGLDACKVRIEVIAGDWELATVKLITLDAADAVEVRRQHSKAIEDRRNPSKAGPQLAPWLARACGGAPAKNIDWNTILDKVAALLERSGRSLRVESLGGSVGSQLVKGLSMGALLPLLGMHDDMHLARKLIRIIEQRGDVPRHHPNKSAFTDCRLAGASVGVVAKDCERIADVIVYLRKATTPCAVRAEHEVADAIPGLPAAIKAVPAETWDHTIGRWPSPSPVNSQHTAKMQTRFDRNRGLEEAKAARINDEFSKLLPHWRNKLKEDKPRVRQEAIAMWRARPM